MAVYNVTLLVMGFAVLGAVVLPRLLTDKPISFPLLYVGAGAALFALPLGAAPPDPVEYPEIATRLTELVVIIALMGAGLKLDRPFDWRAWSTTWRLLGITMPLTIIAVAGLAYTVMNVHPATAILLGAVVSPTDPVLASDVEATPPTSEVDTDVDPTHQEGAIRFALTSEAGLNDGLAFPFTYLAIAAAAASAGTSPLFGGAGWLGAWFLEHVLYQMVVGVVVGYIIGRLIARFVFGRPSSTDLARVMEGGEALAAVLISYGATELLHGYGFIAVFVTALVLRHYEWEHSYYQKLHDFAVVAERMLMAVVLVLFGGVLAGGLLAPLSLVDIAVALATILVIRPLAGLIGLIGSSELWQERLVISSFGIRGIGSFFYLAYALNEASFQELELLVAAEQLWAFLGLVVLTSMVIHGIAATPVMNRLDRLRDGNKDDFVPPEEGAE